MHLLFHGEAKVVQQLREPLLGVRSPAVELEMGDELDLLEEAHVLEGASRHLFVRFQCSFRFGQVALNNGYFDFFVI